MSDNRTSTSNDNSKDNDSTDLIQLEKTHMDWSDKQRRILTANGQAEHFYCAERGFPFQPNELPHHYILEPTNDDAVLLEKECKQQQRLPIVGAWKRTLFYGGTECTTQHDEVTFNLQTHSLFIDLRLPTSKTKLFSCHYNNNDSIHSLEDLQTPTQLQWYARQHVFAGWTRRNPPPTTTTNTTTLNTNCTRFHLIDWNFVGTPRSRPNRWHVELSCQDDDQQVSFWKEWAFARDDQQQFYYCEYWQRLWDGDPTTDSAVATVVQPQYPVVALSTANRQAMIAIVGDHFNYVVNRRPSGLVANKEQKQGSSLVQVVDALIKANDSHTARRWLSIEGGHGRVSKQWKLDHCIEFWKQNTPLWTSETVTFNGSTVQWNDLELEIVESNVSVEEFRQLLPSTTATGPSKRARIDKSEVTEPPCQCDNEGCQ